MTDSLVQGMVDFFKSWLSPEVIIFLVSLLPILELRGGLIAASLLGVPWGIAFPICVIGNMLPIPFILLFIRKIFDFIKGQLIARMRIQVRRHVDIFFPQSRRRLDCHIVYGDMGHIEPCQLIGDISYHTGI